MIGIANVNNASAQTQNKNTNSQNTEVRQNLIIQTNQDDEAMVFKALEILQLNENLMHEKMHIWFSTITAMFVLTTLLISLYLLVMKYLKARREKLINIADNNIGVLAAEISNHIWEPALIDDLATKVAMKNQIIMERAAEIKEEQNRVELLRLEKLRKEEEEKKQRRSMVNVIRVQNNQVQQMKRMMNQASLQENGEASAREVE